MRDTALKSIAPRPRPPVARFSPRTKLQWQISPFGSCWRPTKRLREGLLPNTSLPFYGPSCCSRNEAFSQSWAQPATPRPSASLMDNLIVAYHSFAAHFDDTKQFISPGAALKFQHSAFLLADECCTESPRENSPTYSGGRTDGQAGRGASSPPAAPSSPLEVSHARAPP